MTNAERIKSLTVPTGKIDVVLDTDAYNEIDDQFAIAYLLRSSDKLNTKAIYAAPFLNGKSKSPADGMEKSYDEIIKLLKFAGVKQTVYRGSDSFMASESEPVEIDSTFISAVSPSFITVPLPNCFSICEIAVSSAVFLSAILSPPMFLFYYITTFRK